MIDDKVRRTAFTQVRAVRDWAPMIEFYDPDDRLFATVAIGNCTRPLLARALLAWVMGDGTRATITQDSRLWDEAGFTEAMIVTHIGEAGAYTTVHEYTMLGDHVAFSEPIEGARIMGDGQMDLVEKAIGLRRQRKISTSVSVQVALLARREEFAVRIAGC